MFASSNLAQDLLKHTVDGQQKIVGEILGGEEEKQLYNKEVTIASDLNKSFPHLTRSSYIPKEAGPLTDG